MTALSSFAAQIKSDMSQSLDQLLRALMDHYSPEAAGYDAPEGLYDTESLPEGEHDPSYVIYYSVLHDVIKPVSLACAMLAGVGEYAALDTPSRLEQAAAALERAARDNAGHPAAIHHEETLLRLGEAKAAIRKAKKRVLAYAPDAD